MRRNRSRRLTAVTAAAVLAGGLSLAACGDDGGEEDSLFNEDGTEETDDGGSEETEDTSDSGDSEDSGDDGASESGDGEPATAEAATVPDDGGDEGDAGTGGGDMNDQIRETAVETYQDMLGLDREQAECMVDELFADMGDDMSQMPEMDMNAAMEWLEACGIDPTQIQPGG